MAFTHVPQADIDEPPRPNVERRQRAFSVFVSELYAAFVYTLLFILFLVLALSEHVNWFAALVSVTMIGILAGFALRRKYLYFTFMFCQFSLIVIVVLSLQIFGVI
ncbi:MAG: hypothetical protein HKO02_03120 [Hyphomonadaceae bacterium]|nr:hypothetical protein [Hyphomonadaceae bacterium]